MTSSGENPDLVLNKCLKSNSLLEELDKVSAHSVCLVFSRTGTGTGEFCRMQINKYRFIKIFLLVFYGRSYENQQ